MIGPLGFTLEDKLLRRAGLDYHEWATVYYHENWDAFLSKSAPGRIIAFSTKADGLYSSFQYRTDDALLFGPETRGLPESVRLQMAEEQLKIPMLPHSRSLNLSNAVAVVVYEAWRQFGFVG